ncbi:MAG: hypothetical protein J6U54_22715, partial [Clostridiales bacterium]|nr:hypothetical protein [Clostridiales bacterium]
DDDDDDVFDDETQKNGQAGSYKVDEEVIYDADDIKITATGIVYDDYYGNSLELMIENNSDEKISLYSRNVYVNKCSIDTYMNGGDVKSGSKAYATIGLGDKQIANYYDMKSVGEIEFLLYGYDDEYNNVFSTDNGEVIVQLTTDKKPDEPKFTGGTTIIDEPDLFVQAKMGTDIYGYTAIIVYCENETGKDLYIEADSLEINATTISDAYLNVNVKNGYKGMGFLTLFDNTLSDNHIDEFEKVMLALEVSDQNSWQDSYVTDEIEISVD